MSKKQSLSDEVKTFIITHLAAYEPPSSIIADVKQEFGVEISRQVVSTYDPSTKAGARLGERWKVLFEKSRESFRKDTNDIPLAHKAVRVRTLDRLARYAVEKRNMPLAASLMKQIAEEMGEVYTNKQKHELTGKDGGPIESKQALNVSDLSDDELEAFRIVVAATQRNRTGDQPAPVH